MHIIYSRSPSLKQFSIILTLSCCFLSITQSTNRKHSILPAQTQKLRINTWMKLLFYLQSKPYKECTPSCKPSIDTLVHRDVITILFCVCWGLISVSLFFSLMCACMCMCVTQLVCWVCVDQDIRCQALTRKCK